MRIKAKKDDKTEPLPLVPVRYFLDQDDSAHWYIVEDFHRSEREKWIDADNPEIPGYARRINGPVSLATFESAIVATE